MAVPKVLVIGARGFIGSALCKALIAGGWSVTGVTRGAMPPAAETGVSWVRVDQASQASWNEIVAPNFDVVFHLGWSTTPRTAEADRVADLLENVGGSLRLLTALSQHLARPRLIFASSGGTIYGRTNVDAVGEDHPLRPISSYGVAKQTVETYLDLFRREQGVNSVCARLANPYGPGQITTQTFGAVSTFVRNAVGRRMISIFGSGDITRDYIHIDDLCEALLRLAMTPNAPSCVNVGSGEGTTLLDIVDAIRTSLGRPVAYELLAGRTFDVPRIVLDIGRLTAATGWRPSIPLKEGVARLTAWQQQGAAA